LRSVALPFPAVCCVVVGQHLYCGTSGGAIIHVDGSNLSATVWITNVGFRIYCMASLKDRYLVVGGESNSVTVLEATQGGIDEVKVASLPVTGHVYSISSMGTGVLCCTVDQRLHHFQVEFESGIKK
jgi:hypothetical protein